MTSHRDFDVCIVGGGVVGLAIAKVCAESGFSVIVLEREAGFGRGTSSRNSEVLHSGIYYPKDSLKHRLCLQGNALTRDYCDKVGVSVAQVGKLIVATNSDELPLLDMIFEKGNNNLVQGLEFWDREQIASKEPAISVKRAIFSPSTSIIDSHGFMDALLSDITLSQGMIAFNTKVVTARNIKSVWEVDTVDQKTGEESSITCDFVINSAGLGAWSFNESLCETMRHKIPPKRLCKGHYFYYSRPSMVSRLIYPLPSLSGLGVHATLDLGGRLKFGPDTEWIESEDYTVPRSLKSAFVKEINKYLPDVRESDLEADYAGIRPKLVGPGMSPADFLVTAESQLGDIGYIGLYGIESPGLTSALPLANHVAKKLIKHRGV